MLRGPRPHARPACRSPGRRPAPALSRRAPHVPSRPGGGAGPSTCSWGAGGIGTWHSLDSPPARACGQLPLAGAPFTVSVRPPSGHRVLCCSLTWGKQKAKTRSGSRRWPWVSGGRAEASGPLCGSGSPGVWSRLAGSTEAGWERAAGRGLRRGHPGHPDPGWGAGRSTRGTSPGRPGGPTCACGWQGRCVTLWVVSGVTSLNTHVPGDVRAKWRPSGSVARWFRNGGWHAGRTAQRPGVLRPRGRRPPCLSRGAWKRPERPHRRPSPRWPHGDRHDLWRLTDQLLARCLPRRDLLSGGERAVTLSRRWDSLPVLSCRTHGADTELPAEACQPPGSRSRQSRRGPRLEHRGPF